MLIDFLLRSIHLSEGPVSVPIISKAWQENGCSKKFQHLSKGTSIGVGRFRILGGGGGAKV